MIPHPTRNLVVFDIDGTIANNEHRDRTGPWLSGVSGAERDALWDAYYAAAEHDTPVEAMFRMAWALAEGGWHITLATGRPERYRTDTVAWCKAHRFPRPEGLYMRPEGCRVGNAAMKALHAKAIGPERIALWVDDHPDVPAELAGFGIPVLALHNPVWTHPEDPEGTAR